MAPNYELDCFVKRLDCSVVVKVKVTGKIKNSSECSTQRYLLNRWSFCNETWYGDAPSWTRVSCKKIDLLSANQSHDEGSNDQIYDCFWHIYWTADLFTLKFSWMAHHHKLERCAFLMSLLCVCVCECVEIRLLFSRSRSQGRIKTLLNLYVFYLFCTADLLATKLAVLIYYC